MRAVQFDRYGASDVLTLRTVPVPSPGPDDELVRVHASGLNPKDAMVRAGAMRLLTGRTFPRGTGYDLAGEVVASGARVRELAPGTRVWGFLDGYLGGAAADYVAVPRRWLARLPPRLGWVEGAALPLVASAALQGLRDLARIAARERLLVKGASGGVGSAAIQIARAHGAHVTALASGAGVEYCRALGADAVIDYHHTHLADIDARFDVFLDCVGGSAYGVYRRLLARGGRWVTVAPVPWVYALSPLSTITARLFGTPRMGFVAVKPVPADLDEIGRLVERGLLRMPVTATYPLERVREAHDEVARRHGRGKRVLLISPEAEREAAGTFAGS
ncbi:MAG TPA: NAD(P)-dependent alcohol dehydrogenase, partial [Gemmatimonadaceae bacterium]|nr:NAD(P)-dependent alcohol dehydrogenase [Gemmatimonadaceae bacterium]